MTMQSIAKGMFAFFFAATLIAALPSFSLADDKGTSTNSEEDTKKKDSDSKSKPSKKKDSPNESITEGSINIDGEELKYAAQAGKIIQKTDSGESKAEMFYIAYTEGGLDEDGKPIVDANRPVTFCFNGGPGSSSVWLHLGMLGPRRISLPDDASFAAPPYSLIDNQYSLLDKTDLVFIDPVSTGYSRPSKGEKRSQFHGLEEDLNSVAQFIHDYTTKNKRWSSPKFVLGESYGGLRAAGLAEKLQSRYRMYLNGIVLVSAVLDFTTLDFASNNDLPYILFLPGYTATAWKHKMLSDDLQAKPIEEVVAMSEKFAYGDYADLLLQAASMAEEKRNAIAEEMASLTGLSAEYIKGSNYRVPMFRFSRELLRDQGKMVGRFDSRYTAMTNNRVSERMEFDPSGAAFGGIFSGAMNIYLAEELKYKEERVYEVTTSVWPWNYERFTNSYVTTAGRLRSAMTENPHLYTFAACGYYDLATPPFAMEHTRDHTFGRPDLSDRFDMSYYEGGHMMYVYEPALKKLRKDLLKFYDKATP